MPGSRTSPGIRFAQLQAFARRLLRIHAAPTPAALAELRRELAGLAPAELLERHFRLREEQLRSRRWSLPDLTVRERQVMERVALGETDAQAARVLGVATRTVSKHMENILRKLEVETRTAAAALVAPPLD